MWLWHIYHVIEAVQAVNGTCCGWLYNGSWCADMLCIGSLFVWFESCINKYATKSNLGTCIPSFNLRHNVADTTKTICYEKNEGAVNYSTVAK